MKILFLCILGAILVATVVFINFPSEPPPALVAPSTPLDSIIVSHAPDVQEAASSEVPAIRQSPPAPGSKSEPPQKRSEGPLLALARKDLRSALAALNGKYTGLERDQQLGYLLGELGKERLEVISDLLPLFTARSERAFALFAIEKDWLVKDPSTLIKFMHSQKDGMLKNEFMETVAQSMAELGRNREAAQMITSMPYSRERVWGIGTVAGDYARADIEGAISWVSSLKLPEEISEAQGSMWSALTAKRDLNGLTRFSEIAAPTLRPAVFAEIGKIAGEQGITELQKVVPPQTSEYEQAVVGAMSSVPIGELTELANQAIAFQQPQLKAKAMAKYVERIFAQDQKQAVQWVNSCPPEIRPEAIKAVVNKWYNTDSMAASDWINSMPVGRDRDVALGTLASNLRGSDRAAARDVAAAITDKNTRESLLRSLR